MQERAKKGDWIKIVNSQDDRYANGDIFQVYRGYDSTGCVDVLGDNGLTYYVLCEEYEVIVRKGVEEDEVIRVGDWVQFTSTEYFDPEDFHLVGVPIRVINIDEEYGLLFLDAFHYEGTAVVASYDEIVKIAPPEGATDEIQTSVRVGDLVRYVGGSEYFEQGKTYVVVKTSLEGRIGVANAEGPGEIYEGEYEILTKEEAL